MYILNLILFAIACFVLFRLAARGTHLSRQVLAGLILGIAFGVVLQLAYAENTAIIDNTLIWTNVVAAGYINLLQMMIMPLVLIMMISSVVRMRELAVLGKIGVTIIAILIGTTILASLLGIGITILFDLTAEGLTEGSRELAEMHVLRSEKELVEELSLASMLVNFIPTNIFYDLTGARSTSIISVVLFGILFGIAALQVMSDNESRSKAIIEFVDTFQAIIMKLVGLVMAFTPYGIFALMLNIVAVSDPADILNLANFVIASYFAILIMFAVHMLLLKLSGQTISDYIKTAWPVWTFAFASRSSAATIPLNVKAQVEKLGVSKPIANLSSTFGSIIGQNGCAGIYPSMLAVMIAPTMGVEVLDPSFIAGLVGIVAISSFGVAGVGGGATFSALIVLPAMGFPITLAALLISIEPLIDMARTALNVNGAMTAGVLTNKFLGSQN